MGKILTSESVTEGHPDKVCDQISDAVLDAYLREDKNARVVCECFITGNLLCIGGEITSSAKVDVRKIAKEVIHEIGYVDGNSGFDAEHADILVNIVEQSEDIAVGVNREKICAGDQGMVYGYACDETPSLMPYTICAAHALTKRLAQVRKAGILQDLYPDGKSQISVLYDDYGRIKNIDSIVIAAQHRRDADIGKLRCRIIEEVIFPVIDADLLHASTKIHINAIGVFAKGGPAADSGLTGRKIVVDTYGGIARHGGGAFSGKDPSKADRSAAYLARYIAKNIVAAGLARRCEVEMSFIIGKEDAQTVYINTFGTEKVVREGIEYAVRNAFECTVDYAIRHLQLQNPIYRELAAYGHFGRDPKIYRFERTDKAEELKEYVRRFF